MKDKEKQIEEMAKEMCKVCKAIEETCYMKKQPCSLIKDEATTQKHKKKCFCGNKRCEKGFNRLV